MCVHIYVYIHKPTYTNIFTAAEFEEKSTLIHYFYGMDKIGEWTLNLYEKSQDKTSLNKIQF